MAACIHLAARRRSLPRPSRDCIIGAALGWPATSETHIYPRSAFVRCAPSLSRQSHPFHGLSHVIEGPLIEIWSLRVHLTCLDRSVRGDGDQSSRTLPPNFKSTKQQW